MARKKAPEPVPETPAPGPRRTVLTIKGTEAWRAWLDRLGKFARTPASTLIDHAIVKHARDLGFKEEAPER